MKLTIFALLLISLSACEKSTITNGTGKKEQTTGNSGGSNDGSSGAHIPNNLTNNGSSGTNIPNNSTNNGSSGAPISNNPVPATGSGTKTTGTGTAPTPTAAPTGSGANPATGNSGGSSGSNNNLSTTFDWRSKNLEEIKNFKDANGKNLFELTMNKPEELKELIKKLGDKEALDMALEGDKPPVSDYDNSIITTKSPLPIAIENDDEQALDVLLTIPNIETKLGEKINDNQELKGHDVHNRSSPTLLHIAADKGNIKSFKKIIKKFPSLLEKIDGNKNNPLISSIDSGRYEIIEAFLDSDIPDDKKKNLLTDKSEKQTDIVFYSVYKGQKDIFNKIIEKFPDLINEKYKGKTLAHIAVESNNNNNIDIINLLEQKAPNIFNISSDSGFLPLIYAKTKEVATLVLAKTSKEAIQTCTDKLSLIHQAISDEEKELLQALVEDKSGKVDLGLNCNGQLPIDYIFNKNNDKIEPFIMALNKEQINQKDANGNTALFKAAAYDAEKIPLLAKNEHLEISLENVRIAINNRKEDIFTKNKMIKNNYNQEHIIYLNNNLTRENNKENRDKAIKYLIATNKLTDEIKNNAALTAAYIHDVDSLKALVNAGVDKSIEVNITEDGSIKANALVYQAVMHSMTKFACDVAKKPTDYDNAESFKNLVTQKTNNTLQALKDLGLPKEAFSKGILKDSNNTDINWTNVAYTMLGSVTWYFKEVQDKLKELSELD